MAIVTINSWNRLHYYPDSTYEPQPLQKTTPETLAV